MKNKSFIGFLIIFFLFVYLFLAHDYVYKRMDQAGLKVSDIKGEYLVGSSLNNEKKITYTALGDSLTAGVGVIKYEDSYPYQLAQKMSEGVVNVILHDRAYAGARTSDVVKNLLSSTISDKPDIVTVLIGVNDIHGNISKAEFAKNYTEIIKRLKEETKAKIVVISIPYLGTNSLLLPPFNFYFKYETEEYNKIIKKLAQDNNVKLVDLYTLTQDMFKTPALFSTDLFHPSVNGYKLWAEIIYANSTN